MKSTQDLVRFIQSLSEERNKTVVITIYPDKSFVLYETSITQSTLESIYTSDAVSDALDINDLPYEDAIWFSLHIDELASVEEELKAIETYPPSVGGRLDKYENL